VLFKFVLFVFVAEDVAEGDETFSHQPKLNLVEIH
jgi:hypothetical protein